MQNGQTQALKQCERKVGEIRFIQSELRCFTRCASICSILQQVCTFKTLYRVNSDSDLVSFIFELLE